MYSNQYQVISPLVQTDSFSLSKDEFPQIRNKLPKSTLQPVHKDLSFTVETGALDFAIAATLNQNNKPVTHHARTLSSAEQKHSSVEVIGVRYH